MSPYTPTPPADVSRLADGSCPSSGRVSLTVLGGSSVFACNPGTDYPGNDITGLVAYTLQQCLESCLLANRVQDKKVCVAVAYSDRLSLKYS